MNASKYIILLLVFGLLASGCQTQQFRQSSGNTWGTTYHITYCSDRALDDSIIATMRQVDMALSPFQPQSVISRINRGDTLTSHPWLTEVMQLSQQVCSISSGAFDPTLGPLINLWGFGYKQAGDNAPTQAQIDSVLQYVGIMECGVEDGSVVKKHPRTEFNFSAIAKGYGVDQIAAMLQRNGCTRYLIEVGGEIALSGMNPRDEEWRVQIDAPVPDTLGSLSHQRLMVIPLTDACVATSGNYRNYRIIDGKRKGHTISPVTGCPVVSATLSATVVAPTCAMADALATSCMAMSADSAAAMIASLPAVTAMLVVAEADTFRIINLPSDNISPWQKK